MVDGRCHPDLPRDMTRLVGRRTELARVGSLLAESRLVTLSGTAGVGKTRLALAVAGEFAGRAHFVPLDTVTDGSTVPSTVLRALRTADSGGDDVAAVLAHLGTARDLLVIDNCEHVLEESAALIAAVLRSCPEVRLIATSREPLGISGETVVPVLPLEVPPLGTRVEDLGRYDALLLFVERASAAQHGFAVTAENGDSIAALCRQLDGLPLAIELAAVRTRALPVDELLARQSERLDLLSSGNRAGAPRHQTLRAAMDWSFDLCNPAEQQLWARLSVFHGGFDLYAVERVCGGERLIEAFADLVDKSLVVREGVDRYRQLETIRSYGRERLRDQGEETSLRVRHRDAYLELGRRVDSEWFGPDQVGWARRLRADRANLSAALRFCEESGDVTTGLRMATALSSYWLACGEQREGRRRLDRLLALGPVGPQHAAGCVVAAHLAALVGDGRGALDLVERWRSFPDEWRDDAALAHVTYVSGLARLGAEPSRAAEVLAEGLQLERHLADPGPHLPLALVNLGLAHCILGDPRASVVFLDEARAACEARGDRWVLAWALLIRGVAEWLLGDPDAATQLLRDALRHKHELDDLLGVALACEFLAWTAETSGDPERAAQLFGASRAFFEPLGSYLVAIRLLLAWHEDAERRARAKLGAHRFQQAEDAGRAMGRSDVVRFALGTVAGPAGDQPLTKRELQVAVLLAEGLSNREIAQRLAIAPRTADSHVEHILGKLGLRNRTQVATWVSQRQDR